jgi:hypothetical protein
MMKAMLSTILLHRIGIFSLFSSLPCGASGSISGNGRLSKIVTENFRSLARTCPVYGVLERAFPLLAWRAPVWGVDDGV